MIRGKREGGEQDGEEEIRREEVEKVINRLKGGKAAGVDGMTNEVWKHGGERIKDWLWNFCNRAWKRKGWPEVWKEGVVVPILKKGEGNVVGDYRGVTLMPTAYKIYAAVLAERLKEAIERKELIPHNQTGFRKGMGTIDNVYVLNYLINRQIEKRKGGMVALFVDLKAAFDTVDRKVLCEALREREGLERA